MSADEIYQRLQGLKLFGMAALCDELLAHRERPLPPPEQWLKRMIEAEESERQCRSIRYQMGIAKFPLARDLDSFETADTPVSPVQLSALDRDDFLEQKRNLLLIGGTGTGKTHLAIALGRNAVRSGKSSGSAAYGSQLATSGGHEDKHSDETETLHDESGIFRAGVIGWICLDG